MYIQCIICMPVYMGMFCFAHTRILYKTSSMILDVWHIICIMYYIHDTYCICTCIYMYIVCGWAQAARLYITDIVFKSLAWMWMCVCHNVRMYILCHRTQAARFYIPNMNVNVCVSQYTRVYCVALGTVSSPVYHWYECDMNVHLSMGWLRVVGSSKS